ncbi:ATP/GTP-binding protein [Streptomyces sp. NPDC056653]|uniref:ATP/GTP-binding protein n=1 Tax=Streptomyces sp. NPDC056653 TaxID=3345894 RepID=UPI0036B5E45E
MKTHADDSRRLRPTVRAGWMDYWQRTITPPDLSTCAPAGTADDPVRMGYHATMCTVQTPALKKAVTLARRLWLASSPRSEGPLHLALDGPGETGMTTALRQIGRAFEGIISSQLPSDPHRVPVIHINTPLSPSSKVDWSLPFAEFLSLLPSKAPETPQRSADMTGPVCHVIKTRGTRLVLVDGIDRLDNSEIKTAFDYFSYLASEFQISFVYSGVGARDIADAARRGKRAGAPRGGAGGIPTLAMNPIPYSPEEYGTWHEVIKSFDQNLRLHHHSPGDLLNLAAHLHERTGGYMKPLSYLICQAAQEAIETGIEALTKELLDDQLVGRFAEDPILQI